MLDQTVSLIDIPRLVTLTFLEGALSVDNALSLALIVSHLPQKQQKKALFIGLISAFILRAIGILFAAYFIHFFWIQLIGSLYLIYIALSHFKKKRHVKIKSREQKIDPFWKVVLLVEMTDFIFAIDSILAGIAMIGIHFTPPKLPPKIWIVYFGGVAGMILMRFTAKIFTGLISRFPKLEISASFIVGLIGVKLLTEAFLKAFLKTSYNGLPIWANLIFWVSIGTFFSIGFLHKRRDN